MRTLSRKAGHLLLRQMQTQTTKAMRLRVSDGVVNLFVLYAIFHGHHYQCRTTHSLEHHIGWIQNLFASSFWADLFRSWRSIMRNTVSHRLRNDIIIQATISHHWYIQYHIDRRPVLPSSSTTTYLDHHTASRLGWMSLALAVVGAGGCAV